MTLLPTAAGVSPSSGVALIGCLAVLCAVVHGCDSRAATPRREVPSAALSPPGRPVFVEVAGELGIDFFNERPVTDDYFMPESAGPGGALLDYDNDGDLDVYLVNGFRDAEGKLETNQGANRLYRQDSPDRFTDVTVSTGVGHTGYGMGVAVGDVDNDGFVDLYVTNYGQDCLYRNQSGQTFADITSSAGISETGWSTSAGFFDYDIDGFLDLFVTQYLDYDPAMRAFDAAGRPEYPAPLQFAGVPDALYRNRGDGTFLDVSAKAGLADTPGKGLGVIFTDLNADQLVDIYVANDGEPNFAWINVARQRFEERAQMLGLAVNAYGQPEAGMGIALGDYDSNGTIDLLITHLVQETNTLYRQASPGVFEDATAGSGLGTLSLSVTGFGVAFSDLDQDGDLDLLTANGRVGRGLPHLHTDVIAHWRPYAEPSQLFLNDGRGRFVDLGPAGAEFTSAVEVSRGLALGDLDGDGDLDALVTNGNGTARIYRNQFPDAGNWILVRAVEPTLRREAYGATVTVVSGNGSLQRLITPTSSYLSSSDARAHFGLGSATEVKRIEVRWPDGARELFQGGPANRLVELHRGKGHSG